MQGDRAGEERVVRRLSDLGRSDEGASGWRRTLVLTDLGVAGFPGNRGGAGIGDGVNKLAELAGRVAVGLPIGVLGGGSEASGLRWKGPGTSTGDEVAHALSAVRLDFGIMLVGASHVEVVALRVVHGVSGASPAFWRREVRSRGFLQGRFRDADANEGVVASRLNLGFDVAVVDFNRESGGNGFAWCQKGVGPRSRRHRNPCLGRQLPS